MFQTARNQVKIFEDVEPALNFFSEKYQIVALSNGNADLHEVGLAKYFSSIYSARDIGFAKPDLRIFYAVCQDLNLKPEEVIHVGDDPYNDIHAPRQIGMATVWVNRHSNLWPNDIPLAELEVSDLGGLESIMRQ